MRSQPVRNRRTEAHNRPAILKDAFIGPQLDMQKLTDIPADDRGSKTIGMDVDLMANEPGWAVSRTSNVRTRRDTELILEIE